MPINISITREGLLAPGAIERWAKARGLDAKRALQGGLKDARPITDRIMREETRRRFKLGPTSGDKFLKAWRTRIIDDPVNGVGLEVTNLARWFKMHVDGGTISNRSTPRAILIPINTRFGSRISTKKFYKLIDWLMHEKLTLVKNGILYVKPVMNTSRRGGVAVGSRVSKSFRAKLQGSARRPSGFDIKLNDQGLTPIAIIRSSISMQKRMDLDGIARSKLLPVVSTKIINRFASKDVQL